MRHDRDELLARTDLATLADELLGWHAGTGRNARWPSPVPNHPQTGRTPPMSIFVDHRGIERWTCFATGANGTAIDLVMTATGRTIGDAITWLAERARLDRPPTERTPIQQRRPPEPRRRAPSAALREYVETCERLLWCPEGEAVRRSLLEERCIDAEVLRLNRIGADPGPRILRRSVGLPRFGPAAVFPALDEDGQVVYLQARYLDPPPDRGKYDNPTSAHGSNPRVARVAAASDSSAFTVVAEGMPDALAAATAGCRALAVLGAGLPDARVAEQVARCPGLVAIAFDADAAGRAGSSRLRNLLDERGKFEVVEIEPPRADLNNWLIQRGPLAFRRQLALAIQLQVAGMHRDAPGRSIA